MLTPSRIIIIFFIFLIGIGTLSLFFLTNSFGKDISFVDSLFTATSASCVTGLVVLNTGADFPFISQLVILLLIQAGGLGIVTFSAVYIFAFGQRANYEMREVSRMSYTPGSKVKIGGVLKTIAIYTAIIELAGAILLFLRWQSDYPFFDALWYSFFHSISAFCNAGFSLFKESFISYRFDPIINVVICALIFLGGIGFFVIYELYEKIVSLKDFRFRKFSLHTKLVLTITLWLLIIGFMGFMVFEWSNVLKGLPFYDKVLLSLFQSITPRTAGFNTVDMSSLTDSTLFLFVILMFIGASPGSTGGGIKTTSFGILLFSAISKIRGEDSVLLYERRIKQSSINKVLTLVILGMVLIVIITMLVTISEYGGIPHRGSEGRIFDVFFETVSAFGTVGLSVGITPQLTYAGKLLIILTMFLGRIGPLTLAVVLSERVKRSKISYPDEDVMIG
ncbi:MAG: Trk family potassium uptake protein [Candidatus Schekmanbacteria bacterium]|nr:MAG: Trk family potassium uptake protein [Candidatus Schekmanbacteria bacterium]